MSEIQGYKSTIAHDSFFGFLNLFRISDKKHILRASERPPYPIINANPTLGDSISNLNRADFGLFSTVSFLGFFVARRSVGTLYSTEFLRRRGFSIAWNSFIMFGLLFAIQNSSLRLTGFVENGLQWRRKEQVLKKYDFTSDWEKGTFWSYLRIRDQQ